MTLLNRLSWFRCMSVTVAFLVLAGPAPLAFGQLWSPLVNVHPQTLHDDKFPHLINDLAGMVWIVWMGVDATEGDTEVYYSRWNGTGWEPAGLVNPPNQTDDLIPRIACARDGSIRTLWKVFDVSGTGTYAGVTSQWTGSGWSTPDTVWTGGGSQDVFDIAATSVDEAWFVRDGATGSAGDSDIRVYHINRGVHDSELKFDDPDSVDVSPRITVDAGGFPWVTWIKTPPLSPDRSRLAFTRFVSGSWSSPRSLPVPEGINRNTLFVDSDDVKWIVCSGADPEVGPFSDAVWALRWLGGGWSIPQRISDPIASSDSIQYQLSISRGCGGYPRAVWVRGDIFTRTRRDIVTTAWDGTRWSALELAGNLADSTDAQWPATTAELGGRVWVAYMRLVAPSYVSNIVTTYKPYVTTSVSSAELTVSLTANGVELRWHLSAPSGIARIEIHRAKGTYATLSPPSHVGAQIVAWAFGDDVSAGTRVDDSVNRGAAVTYWLRAVRTDGGDWWSGPQFAQRPTCGPLRLDHSAPNPSLGSVSLRGSLGAAHRGFLDVFNAQGQLIRKIPVSPSVRSEGDASGFVVNWDGRDRNGRMAPRGVYLIRLRSSGEESPTAIRVVLLR